MYAQHRGLVFALAFASLLLAVGCARPGAMHNDAGPGGRDVGERADTNTPGIDTPCGPAGQACCAGNTCELGLRCARGTCCLQANSATHCASSSDCCAGLTCTGTVCCAGRSSTCTGSSDCCNGLVCSGGVCLSPDMGDLPGMMGCGGAGGMCCTGFTCRSGLVCNASTGHCEGCGEAGGRCCDGATSCVSTSLVCNPATGNCETAPDPAMRCGRIDGPCCGPDRVSPAGDGTCEGGLVCTGGTCSDAADTGGPGQPCDPRGGCDSGNLCDHSTNMCSETPSDCGHDMMMCCDTGGTTQSCDGHEACQFGQCSMCQGPSLTCLLAGVPIIGMDCCNGSVCRPAPLIPRCCVGAGQMCTNSLDCCGLMQCGSDHTCTAGRQGSLCVDSSECADGLTCQLFMCQPDPMAGCMPQGQTCSGSASCCTGFTCGVSHSATMTMTPTVCCTAHDGACQSSDECCGHMPCEGGTCSCRDVNETCFRDAECCGEGTDMTGMTGSLGCVAGECQIIDACERPGSPSVTCTGRDDCCYGLECLPRHEHDTTLACCQQGGTPCQHDTDCCGTMTCTMGVCTCQAVGMPCANTTDCCGSAFCTAGHCGT
jgi:hypothetical protein